jgi:hypothetical protein
MTGFKAKPALRVFYSDHPHALLCLKILPAIRMGAPAKWVRSVGDFFRTVCGAPISKQNKPT